MIVINRQDFEKYGCVHCGCKYCYNDGIHAKTSYVVCKDCKTAFYIINNYSNYFAFGWQTWMYDGIIMRNGEAFYNGRNVFNLRLSDEQNFKLWLEFCNKIFLEKGYAIGTDVCVFPILQRHPRSYEYPMLNEKLKISEEIKQQFLSDWQIIEKMITSLALKYIQNDFKKFWNALGNIFVNNPDFETESEFITKEANKYGIKCTTNVLFGLVSQVSKNIKEDQIEKAILTVIYVANELQFLLSNQLEVPKNNNDFFEKIQVVYVELSQIVAKYYAFQIDPDSPRKLTRKPY